MALMDILSGGAKKAANSQKQGLIQGQEQAFHYLDDARRDYGAGATAALGEYDAYSPTLEKGFNTYADALGLNGAQGNANAQSAFTAGPGYQFLVDEATQAALRAGSAQGNLASGNTTAAITDRASGLANQEWSSWLDRLNGLGTQGLGVAQQRSGIQTGIGQVGYDLGKEKAQVGWNTQTGIGNANAQQAQAEGAGVLGAISLGTKLLGGFGGMGGGSVPMSAYNGYSMGSFS